MSSMPTSPHAVAKTTALNWLGMAARSRRLRLYLLAVLTLAGSFYLMTYVLPYDPNWYDDYYPAGRALLAGHNPYLDRFVFTPWFLVIVAPLSLLPPALGRFIFAMLGVFGFAYTAQRFKASRLALTAFLLSPPVILNLTKVDIDGLMVLGLFLPPQLGLFFVTLKPQFGAAIALFWLVETWRTRGWRAVVWIFAPITVAGLLSIIIFGPWFTQPLRLISTPFNASLFPMTIPVGLALLAQSLRSRDIRFAIPAAPCLSPYVTLPTWSVALLAIVHDDLLLLVAVAGFWIERVLTVTVLAP